MRDRYDFCVGYGLDFDEWPKQRLADMGVQLQHFPRLRHMDLVGLMPAALSVRAFLRANRFDIVHTHMTEAGLVGRWAAHQARVPVIIHHLHGDIFEGRSRWKGYLLSLLERYVARRTTRFLSNARQITGTYLDRGIGTAAQFTTVRTPVDLDAFRRSLPSSVPLPKDTVRVITIARVVRDKGYSELVHAARGVLQTTRASVVFVVVGEGEFLEETTRMVREFGLEAHFRFIPRMNGDEIAGAFGACDIFTLASYREGIPRVMIEAMAAGLAPVVTDVGGISEVVRHGENGLLVPSRDVESLRQALTSMVEDDELRQRCRHQAAKSVQEFEAAAVVDQIAKQYQALLV
jgi:glycosyltransferase involved in cell wall biosynthesis